MWYKKDYRRVFMDMHLNDTLADEYLSKLNVKSFVNTLKGANVNNIVVKAKSHVGLHYWPSKYGKIHEGLKRRKLDYVGEMISACKKENISVTVYLSQVYDNYAYDTHPSWRTINSNGIASRENGGRYGLVCPNNPEYRAYTKEILEELLDLYDFQGMFLDMPFWPNVCYCHCCRERFLKETGNDIPRNEDINNPVWEKFLKLRQEWIEEFVNFNTTVIKNKKSHVSVEHNFAAVGLNWVQGDTEKLLEACDYAGGDYYGGYLEQTFMCKYYNSVTPNKPFVYITSRCDPNLFAHTVSRCKDDLLIHTMNALVHNGAFSMCDAMNPDGTINNEVYESSIGPVYKISEKYEKYMSGKMNTDVDILYSTNLKVNDNFLSSPLALAKVLQENNVLYNVIGSKNLSEITSPVLAISGAYTMTDNEMNDIESYLANGGNVFITGKLPHPKFFKLLDASEIAESEYAYTYITPTNLGGPLFETFNTQSPYPLERKITEYTVDGDYNLLATLSYPYTKANSKDFSAIHSNPPGTHTTLPAVIEKNVGNGKILWSITPLELTSAHFCKKTVWRLIDSLINTPKISSNAPAFVEITSWEKDGDTYLGIINQQSTYPLYPIQGISINLPTHYREINLLTPSCTELEIIHSHNGVTIKLPAVESFHIIKLQK